MKTTIISTILAISLTLTGCEQPSPKEDTPSEFQTKEKIHSIVQSDVEIVLIDDCQYIIYNENEGTNRGYGYMSHKGNCNNPVHFYKYMTQSLTLWKQSDTTTNETD